MIFFRCTIVSTVITLILFGCDYAPPVLPHDIGIGVGIYLDRALFDGQRTHTLVDLATSANMKWSREEFHWDQIEPERGVLDEEMLDRYDRAVFTLREHGISILGLLAYRTPWSSGDNAPANESERADYAKYASAMVDRYHDSVHVWEIWNEPNLDRFWPPEPDPQAYAELLKTAYTAIKQVDPSAMVIGCSTSGVSNDFIESVLDAGGAEFMDAISIHPYSGNEATDTADERQKIRDLRITLQKRSVNLPLWVTEVGFQTSTNENGVSESEQGNLLVRSYLTLFSEGIDTVINYDFADDGVDPDEGEENFGVLHHDLTIKPAYNAMANIGTLLANSRFEKTVATDSSIETMVFSRSDGKYVWAVWTVRPNGPLGLGLIPSAEIDVPVTGTVEAIYDLYGTPLSVNSENPSRLLPTSTPVFLIVRP